MLRFPFYFFLPGRNELELDKGAMVGVNGRLKREATSYPARVERRKDIFCFVYSFSSHFSRPRSWSLLSSSIL